MVVALSFRIDFAQFSSVSILSVDFQYRYATKFDYFLIVIGCALSAGQGVFYSASSLVFRKLTDVLIDCQTSWVKEYQYHVSEFDYDKCYDGAMHAIWMYVYFGTGAFTAGFLSV